MVAARSPARRLGRLEPSQPAGEVDGRLRHRVGDVADFVEGRFRIFDVGGREIGVIRTAEGFFAVANVCPHQGAPICLGRVGGTWLESRPGDYVYGLDGSVVRCPWHSWEFTVTDGQAVAGITSKRLTTYPVAVEGTTVLVTAGRARVRLDTPADRA
jgi:3-phenylpropionate/trans-cinnamate dioxygenase ferredoxin subunit